MILSSNKIKLGLLMAAIVLAAFFRLHRIDQLPPGDGYDPAYYGVDALQILRGDRPIFLSTNIGREVLFSYIVAAFFLVMGPSTQAIHTASALIGVLTVPATYLVAEELFSDEEGLLKTYGGPVSALMMALSYWHLNWSRYGVRAILVPLFTATTFYFLWRGLRTGKRGAFVLCGVSLGLSMYTYQAARLIPLLIVIGFASVIRHRQSITRRDWGNLLIVIGVSLLIFAPLGCYFLIHPDSFFQRADQVIVINETQNITNNLCSLFNQLTKALSSFYFTGDQAPYRTLPGRPFLNSFFAILSCLGIGISLTRIGKPGYSFLLAWLIVMFTPAALAGQGSAAKRAIGTLPVVAILIAVGALAPWWALRRRTSSRSVKLLKWITIAWTLFIVSGFIYSGFATYYDYFIAWGSNPNLFTHFEAGISAIGDYINKLPPEEQVYVSPELPHHPAMRFHSGLREDIRGYNGRVCLVAPERVVADTTYIIVPGKDGRSLNLLRQYLPQGQIVGDGPLHYGEPYFLAYRIPTGSEAKVTPEHTLKVNWADCIQLMGYDVDSKVYQPGNTLHLTLYYKGLKSMKKHYTAFTHLLGPYNSATEGPLWGQQDSEPCQGFYPTTSWRVGEIVIDRLALPIPVNAPSGEYSLSTGFYNVWTMERLPVLNANPRVENDIVPLGRVKIGNTQ